MENLVDEFIRGEDVIKCADLRKTLNISSSLMSNIMKKHHLKGRTINGAQARQILLDRGYQFSREAKVAAYWISKGGTAKSTSCRFTAQRLAEYGFKVCIIDTDPQWNLTLSFHLSDYGVKLTPEDPVISDVLDKSENISIEDTIINITPNLDLVPSTPVNSKCDNVIRQYYKNPANPLKDAIKSIRKKYDYILFDCGPTISITNTAVIGASDYILLPVDPCEFSIAGIEQSFHEIDAIVKECNIKQNIVKKIFLTKYDEREYLSVSILSDLHEKYDPKNLGKKKSDNLHFDDKILFDNHIRKSTDLKNCISEDKNLFSIAKSRAAKDYDGLVIELAGLDSIAKKGK